MALAQTKVTIAYTPVIDFLPAYVAKERGFFEKNGLNANLMPIIIASNIVSAMVAGDVQIGLGTAPNMLMANEGGLDFVAIYGVTRDTKGSPMTSLITRKATGIKNAADLTGKKIGVPGLNSVIHIFTMKWLTSKGMPADKATFVELPMPQLGDVLKAGNVDAIAVIEPFRSNVLKDPDSVLVANTALELRDNMMLGYWQATRSWAKANAPAIKGFRAAIDEGLSFIQKNPDEAKAIAAKYLRFVPPSFPHWDFNQTPEDFQYQADITRELGLLKKPVDVNSLIWK
jgi:NitT/TauT family transport system substrate-binding protein